MGIVESFIDKLNQPGTVFLETTKPSEDNNQSYLFSDPVELLIARSADDLPEVFSRIEEAIANGFYVAGFLSYEAGYHFEPKTLSAQHTSTDKTPHAWFGLYNEPITLNPLANEVQSLVPDSEGKDLAGHFHQIENLKFTLTKDIYRKKIDAIKSYIQTGDVYQINFTGKFTFDFEGDPVSLYSALRQKQPVPYSAFIKTEEATILSFSPELFFRIDDAVIQTKPMKGTILRGLTPDEDARLAETLRESGKNRAENLMIVDLLRNDIGRVCKKGSVEVTDLFRVETYKTLHQMTSTVKGVLRDEVRFYDLFKAIYPCGSVTGAPKIRAMQLISELESETRGVYTGAIGFITPKRDAVFNVAIRTVVINDGKGEMGSGSGVVWDSDAGEEYRECELKAAFLSGMQEDFELIETMLWDGGYPLLERHLARLARSATHFGYAFNDEAVRKELEREAELFESGKKYKVRLTLDRAGSIKLESVSIELLQNVPLQVCLARKRIDSQSTFLYHKTTRRKLYDDLFKKATEKGFADVLFMNEQNHITEGAISNVVIRKAGVFFTPPVESGLLPGVFREHFLAIQKDVVEKVLTLDDLRKADEVWICNAVRGLRKVRLVETYLD
ncbi:MAG: aminodeoxychorismate synthase component I [Chlorobiales bacterium]|nr:aminodeoxychorismate synthase component I [Chlorobiales bacterium]